MFQVKICGITRLQDAQAAGAAGADAVGLNFYPASPRYLSRERAQAWVGQLPAGLLRVGVFVNADVATIAALADGLPLDAIQLHGEEPPELLVDLPRPVIRAFRCPAGDIAPIGVYLEQCDRLGARPAMVLVDAWVPGAYGGTGNCPDWPTVRAVRQLLGPTRLVLAGGLTPENVGQAIAAVGPDAVDTASGVESSPGIKDAAKLQAFVAAARQMLTRRHPG